MINKQIKSHARIVKRSFSAEIFFNKDKAKTLFRNFSTLITVTGHITAEYAKGTLYLMKKRSETEAVRKAWADCIRTLNRRQLKILQTIPSED